MRSLLLRTPGKKLTLWLLIAAWWFLGPMNETIYYYVNHARGFYPPGFNLIPSVAVFTMGWVAISPLVFGFVWFTLRDYPGAVSLFAFNPKRPIWSGIWTAACLLDVGDTIYCFYGAILDRHPVDAAYMLFEGYLAVCLRSSIIYSNAFKGKRREVQKA